MPNIIPPIVSSSPPPLDPIEDDDNDDEDHDDEFGDFTTANLPSINESTQSKTITDTSWPSTGSKQLYIQSEVFENGAILPKVSSEVTSEQILNVCDVQETDSTSHGSVVTVVTDADSLSVSQNINGTTLMPDVEGESKSDSKSQAFPVVDNDCLDQSSGESVLSDPSVSDDVPIEDFTCLNGRQICSNDRNLILNHIYDEVKSQDLACTSSPANNSSGAGNGVKGLCADQNIETTSEVRILNQNEEYVRVVEKLSDVLSSAKDESRESSDKSDKWRNTDSPVCKSVDFKDEENEECVSGLVDRSLISSLSSLNITSVCDANNTCGDKENQHLNAMIIPEMPCLDLDYDKKEELKFDSIIENDSGMNMALKINDIGHNDFDDEFGEFTGTTGQDAGYTDDVIDYDSPSRRPTLVLTDDTIETATKVQVLADSLDGKTDSSGLCIDISPSSEPSDPNPPANSSPDDKTESSSTYQLHNANADEFADFTHAEVEYDRNGDSDAWAQATMTPPIPPSFPPNQDTHSSEMDDFDDFASAEFQSASTFSQKSLFDLEAVKLGLHELLKESFPITKSCIQYEVENISSAHSGTILDVEESSVWQGLRDLEATPSLNFQWPGSQSNRGLLGALNIDSRNILFGPKWNTVVPRFAANLGFSPLEPVRASQIQPPSEPTTRAEIIPSQVVESNKSSPSDEGEVVPAAQFDWSDSGLTNPLDSTTHSSLLDIDLLASFDNLTSCSPQTVSTSHAAMVCRRLSTSRDLSNGCLATTAASGNPVLTSTPLQVEQLLANSKRSATVCTQEKKSRDPSLSAEAVRVLDTLPELAFLSARMLMFPVHGECNENKL